MCLITRLEKLIIDFSPLNIDIPTSPRSTTLIFEKVLGCGGGEVDPPPPPHIAPPLCGGVTNTPPPSHAPSSLPSNPAPPPRRSGPTDAPFAAAAMMMAAWRLPVRLYSRHGQAAVPEGTSRHRVTFHTFHLDTIYINAHKFEGDIFKLGASHLFWARPVDSKVLLSLKCRYDTEADISQQNRAVCCSILPPVWKFDIEANSLKKR